MHAHSCILHMLTYRCMCLNLGYPLSCTRLHVCLYTLNENAVRERAHTHTHTNFQPPNLTPVHKHTHAHSCHALLSSIVNMLYIYKDTCTHLNPPPLTHHTQQFMYSLSAWRALSYKSPGWGCGCWRRKSCRRTPFPLQERPATACACHRSRCRRCCIAYDHLGIPRHTHSHAQTRANASLLLARTRTHVPTYAHTHTHTHPHACAHTLAHTRTHVCCCGFNLGMNLRKRSCASSSSASVCTVCDKE
jgi:hypothetical protein